VIQIAGDAFRVSAKDVAGLLPECPEFAKRLHRYSQELTLQSMQLAACNRVHEVDARLARWLLMSEDRVNVPEFSLTQESLANMLGTRRASVTVAAGILQGRGLITYKRGLVKIKNRRELEAASCECYRATDRQLRSWRKTPG
jgi:CRP-like cAMP-binding protein